MITYFAVCKIVFNINLQLEIYPHNTFYNNCRYIYSAIIGITI